MTHNLRSSRLRLAALGFSLAWIVGLAIPVPLVDVDASSAAAIDAVTGHELATALRSTLVHAFAAVAIAVIALRLGGRAAVAGLIAAALSVTQWVLELVMAVDPDRAGTLLEVVNRVDGLKMFALAALALFALPVLPRWLRIVGIALAVSIVLSGVGYALLIPPLATAAIVSLPLLLVFMTGTGLTLATRRTHA